MVNGQGGMVGVRLVGGCEAEHRPRSAGPPHVRRSDPAGEGCLHQTCTRNAPATHNINRPLSISLKPEHWYTSLVSHGNVDNILY